jgi:hypothetical protein
VSEKPEQSSSDDGDDSGIRFEVTAKFDYRVLIAQSLIAFRFTFLVSVFLMLS